MSKRKQLAEANAVVAKAATDFIREVECPAPDLVYRAALRDRLASAVHELEEVQRG
ncbi:hypothetical protein [Leucobacter sp. cx-169]|uniref:hypothetical protein n=1 Tax=Leucobacter sp. cx-169 TaxID=2770549 RepID=UPI00165E1C74|nr:hypothetical protein [Leucobacter sp. cx-169]MBC9927205.1 hypothetical protein [Leucobacter sp. cx-169]